MDQPEEVLEKLERFNIQKNPEITRELDEYVSFVARTGESVFNWALVKRLYREKLISVITEFYNEAASKELPVYPNVDPFNYETMKKMLIERLDSFNAAPFTIQRISELLADPRKQYSRIDKFMRAVEKNILVVSTVSPGRNRSEESENGDSLDDSVGLNGDFSSDVNVDVDMDNENDGSFTMTKEFNATTHRKEANHEIVSVTQETVTIKKAGTKEEEASTSAIAVDTTNGEPLQPTQTDITVESQTSVTITVCEPTDEESKAEATSSLEDTEATKPDENAGLDEEQKPSDEELTAKEAEPIATQVTEPKIDDDALLNEPLRPADDEILVETAPLVALENIVANRTVIETVETSRIEEQLQKAEPIVEQQDASATTQEEQTESKKRTDEDETIEGGSGDSESPIVDDSGIAAKRLKLNEGEEEEEKQQQQKEEAAETITEQKVVTQIEEVTAEQIAEPIVEISSQVEAVIVEEPSDEQSQPEEAATPSNISVEATAQEDPAAVATETPIVEEIETEASSEQPAEGLVPEFQPEAALEVPEIQPAVVEEPRPVDEMEAAPIVENPMALDEEVVAAPSTEPAAEMEVTPVAGNKMDTDTETENALMDVDDDEPMDQ